MPEAKFVEESFIREQVLESYKRYLENHRKGLPIKEEDYKNAKLFEHYVVRSLRTIALALKVNPSVASLLSESGMDYIIKYYNKNKEKRYAEDYIEESVEKVLSSIRSLLEERKKKKGKKNER